jgi:hypothetical protein
MSSSFSVYFGPYLFVPLHTAKVTTTSHACSANCGAPATSLGRFCSSCGAAVVATEEESSESQPLFCHDLSSRMSDLFWTPESCVRKNGSIWLPNFRGSGMTFEIGSPVFDFTDEYIASQKEKVMTNFIPAIEELKSMYNVEAEIRFGIVPYVD